MTVEELARILATCLGLIISFASVWGLIVSPFRSAIKSNDETMRSLQDTIKELAFEIKESQKDRELIHKQLDRHEERIGKAEDDVIAHNERISTLFKTKEDKK